MSSQITCPNCRVQIEITEVISAQLEESIRGKLDAEMNAARQRLKQQQEELALRQRELAQKAEAVDEQVRAKLAQERRLLEQKTLERAREEFGVELKDRDAELARLKAKAEEAEGSELAFRREKRELEDKLRTADLEVERRLQEELKKVREQALKELDEQHRLRFLEKEQQIEALRRQIDDLKRSAEQGSQQAQGEVLEVALEQLLRELFPTDAVEPVPKGVRGADVIHRIFDENGMDCGVVLWESKRTRHWSKDWLPKLRDDLRAVKASCSIIVSEQLPEHVRHFGQIDGVWVASWACVPPVAMMLREGLIAVAKSRRALDGQHSKMELVYNYLIGQEFCNRVWGICEAFMTMREDLEAEKRAFTTHWNKRAKQLERVLVNTSGLWGDLQGIVGKALPQIKGMSLAALGPEPAPDAKALPDGQANGD